MIGDADVSTLSRLSQSFTLSPIIYTITNTFHHDTTNFSSQYSLQILKHTALLTNTEHTGLLIEMTTMDIKVIMHWSHDSQRETN